jgi:poly(ADP-ribose) glycohydrolase ARH3
MTDLPDRFSGCLLGLALGDAAGAPWEGLPSHWIRDQWPETAGLLDPPLPAWMRYTDDTQMMIGVAQTLVEEGRIVEQTLCGHFAANFDPDRGYGSGSRTIIEAILAERDHRQVAATMFEGGSYGNGAAMRVAPVGLFFHGDADRVWDEARLSALPTHTHPLGIEGAQLLALGVALCIGCPVWDRALFFKALAARCRTDEFRGQIEQAASAESAAEIATLGNGIEAHRSVPAALACFARHPDDFAGTVTSAIRLGGDTDTIAAMAGALAGARVGAKQLPSALLNKLEDGRQGRAEIIRLATELYERQLPAE